MVTRTCSRCEQTLPASAYSKSRAARDGLQSWCKACQRENRLNGTRTSSTLAVECWCRYTIVHVPPAEIMACRTASCGRGNCAPPPTKKDR